MSGEIVVGACYRLSDGGIIRVTARGGGLVAWTQSLSRPRTQSLESCEEFHVSEDRFATYWPVRVPDPTPAIDDAEPPLAGEMTLRQVEAWRVRRGIDDLSLMYATRTGLWHAHAERDGTVIGHGTSSDPQDAITALMAWVGP